MSNQLWIAVILIAIGTFLMRLLPMLWMSRRMRAKSANSIEHTPLWLSVLGPNMIAAMLGTSLIPSTPSLTAWLATFLGCIVTIIFWYWKRSLGLPVFAGVLMYGVVIYLGG